jgi:hypothetical protein
MNYNFSLWRSSHALEAGHLGMIGLGGGRSAMASRYPTNREEDC